MNSKLILNSKHFKEGPSKIIPAQRELKLNTIIKASMNIPKPINKTGQTQMKKIIIKE